jgi:hypothetical protein
VANYIEKIEKRKGFRKGKRKNARIVMNRNNGNILVHPEEAMIHCEQKGGGTGV